MLITFVVIAAVFGWAVWIYNRLVRDRVRVETGWSDIDVQLKRRHDLIPKLVEAVKQYAEYESATLEAVTSLRANAESFNAAAKVGHSETRLSSEIKKLIAVAEDYPELKADRSFLDLQRNLTDVEDHIQFARRYYNGAVRNLNIRIDSFPDVFLARAFGFEKAQFFDFDEPPQETA